MNGQKAEIMSIEQCRKKSTGKKTDHKASIETKKFLKEIESIIEQMDEDSKVILRMHALETLKRQRVLERMQGYDCH